MPEDGKPNGDRIITTRAEMSTKCVTFTFLFVKEKINIASFNYLSSAGWLAQHGYSVNLDHFFTVAANMEKNRKEDIKKRKNKKLTQSEKKQARNAKSRMYYAKRCDGPGGKEFREAKR